jgi:L-lactate dehydrogenase (cytochrome)
LQARQKPLRFTSKADMPILPTVSALPAIVDVVGDAAEVLVDGGIRSGLDVVKALALGARACLVGRPWAYAVAARGEGGVAHILRILRQEMEVAMGLTEVTDVSALNRSALVDDRVGYLHNP